MNARTVRELGPFITVDGMRVHYLRAGKGPPVILLHGLVGSARNWQGNLGALAKISTVYAIDAFNMGESDRVQGLDASLEATADRAAACMDALGLDQADVVGHSHGGAVAMMLAARHPQRVGTLILFAPANPFCDAGHQLIRFYQSRLGNWFAQFIPRMPRAVHATALGRMYGDPRRVGAGILEGYTVGLQIPGTVEHVMRIVGRWFEDMRVLQEQLEDLADRPVLLVWGDRDRAVGLRSAHRLMKVLRRSKLEVIPGAGHIAFEEWPEVCNRLMVDWLQGARVMPGLVGARAVIADSFQSARVEPLLASSRDTIHSSSLQVGA